MGHSRVQERMSRMPLGSKLQFWKIPYLFQCSLSIRRFWGAEEKREVARGIFKLTPILHPVREKEGSSVSVYVELISQFMQICHRNRQNLHKKKYLTIS